MASSPVEPVAGANFTCPPGLVVVVTSEDLSQSIVETDSGTDLWVLGVILSVACTFFSAVGGVLIKHASNLARAEQPERTTPVFSKSSLRVRAAFVCGNLSIAFLGPILDIVALTMAAQSIIIPIAGLTIVWNFLLATVFLKEKYTCVPREAKRAKRSERSEASEAKRAQRRRVPRRRKRTAERACEESAKKARSSVAEAGGSAPGESATKEGPSAAEAGC
jgi:predicted lipid-binding transport protein (Tim44 family)